MLTNNLVELDVLHSTPELKEHTPDIELKAWDRIKLSFEYFMFYHTGKPFDSLLFYDVNKENLRDDIMIAYSCKMTMLT